MQTHLAALKQQHQTWVEAVNHGDLEGWKAIVTEDIVWIPPGETVIEGRAALVAWLRPFLEAFEYEYAVTGQVVRVAGERALERSNYVSRLRSRSDGDTEEHEGSYIALWRREGGRWYMERYVDISELALSDG